MTTSDMKYNVHPNARSTTPNFLLDRTASQKFRIFLLTHGQKTFPKICLELYLGTQNTNTLVSSGRVANFWSSAVSL